MTKNNDDIAFKEQMHRLIGIADLAGSVVRVGDGRGFIVHTDRANYVITAAHVIASVDRGGDLPSLPQPHLGRYLEEETYFKLIGARGAKPKVTAACVFVDLIADLAVLGPPDNQELSDECEAYEAFTAALPPFDIAAPPPRSRLRLRGICGTPGNFVPHKVTFPAHVLSLEGAWIDCCAANHGGPLVIKPEKIVVPGMSGSPLIGTTGAALGVISTSNMAACLTNSLPGWLLRMLACSAAE
jgi:hypothetical protein